jgi:hypothetical protein
LDGFTAWPGKMHGAAVAECWHQANTNSHSGNLAQRSHKKTPELSCGGFL